jgi:NAD(P)H-hydrate epimerase
VTYDLIHCAKIICGPGNNGGDGLVASRHLALIGYDVTVLYPKRSSREKHYSKLVSQSLDVGVKFVDSIPENEKYNAVVDAIFGFSFKGEPREPFSTIIAEMIRMQKESDSVIISVDVPSGWNVDEGDTLNLGFYPDVLVSLTAPKFCAKGFKGRHFVGGRFLPPNLAKAYNIKMPPYPGLAQVMEVNKKVNNHPTSVKTATMEGWEAEYAAYCIEKEKQLTAKEEEGGTGNKIKGVNTDFEDWAVQYHNYCVEKEARLAREEEMKSSSSDVETKEDDANK